MDIDLDVDELLDAYRLHARQYGEAVEYEIANLAVGDLLAIREALCETGQSSRILELLSDDNEYVRLWAGMDALYLSPDEGERVLERLVKEASGRARTDAVMILWARRGGNLVLAPWEKP